MQFYREIKDLQDKRLDALGFRSTIQIRSGFCHQNEHSKTPFRILPSKSKTRARPHPGLGRQNPIPRPDLRTPFKILLSKPENTNPLSGFCWQDFANKTDIPPLGFCCPIQNPSPFRILPSKSEPGPPFRILPTIQCGFWCQSPKS